MNSNYCNKENYKNIKNGNTCQPSEKEPFIPMIGLSALSSVSSASSSSSLISKTFRGYLKNIPIIKDFVGEGEDIASYFPYIISSSVCLFVLIIIAVIVYFVINRNKQQLDYDYTTATY